MSPISPIPPLIHYLFHATTHHHDHHHDHHMPNALIGRLQPFEKRALVAPASMTFSTPHSQGSREIPPYSLSPCPRSVCPFLCLTPDPSWCPCPTHLARGCHPGGSHSPTRSTGSVSTPVRRGTKVLAHALRLRRERVCVSQHQRRKKR